MDRLTLIMELGALATASAQRGDDRAADVLRAAAEQLFADKSAVDALEDRREHERIRQKNRRSSHVTSRDITGQPVTSRTAPQGFPTPLPNPSDNNTTTPRARDDALYVESVENLTGMVSGRMGDEFWPDADAFLKRRQYSTWGAWLKEMLVALNGSATPADLAQVCRDESALERPIGAPKAFRAFVASAIAERKQPTRPTVERGGKQRGGVAARTWRNGLAALGDGTDG